MKPLLHGKKLIADQSILLSFLKLQPTFSGWMSIKLVFSSKTETEVDSGTIFCFYARILLH